MVGSTDDLLKLVNGAGYLFQERLCREIWRTHHQHGWSVVAEEHRWCAEDGSEGFIDLVLSKGHFRMVIEAKRTRDASWVFLVPKFTHRSQGRTRCLWTEWRDGEPVQSAWRDFQMLPISPEAKFCIIRGKGDRDQPMLERLGGVLLRSTESLAEEELQLSVPGPHWERRFYFPVIVTNSQMYVCFYDPEEVDLKSGDLPDGEFEPVDFVRFRKGLSTRLPTLGGILDLGESNRAKERTIFVASGEKMVEILRSWDI